MDSLPDDACAISVITSAELIAGCRNRTEQRAVERELELYDLFWLSDEISELGFKFYKQYRLSHNVGFLDCLIAATAIQNDLRLATLNLKHFPFSNLEIARPY